ncbi:hypothetical protein [Weissella koreensis]|uniref:hypothetical protein n=1 Tax=Weissella koreensis TaxID=165096 RepID=UPI000CF344D0|nr:hypothetical protein [Weissella koreensis]AVH74703.1 hypothetical protein C4597_01130 [Weissella koreensis]QGN19926.1 hypothetical protein GKC51_01100 [Weissella koreensis]
MNKIKTFTIMLIATLGIVVGLGTSSASAADYIKDVNGHQLYTGRNEKMRMHTKRYGEELTMYSDTYGWLSMGKVHELNETNFFTLMEVDGSFGKKVEADKWYKLYLPNKRGAFVYQGSHSSMYNSGMYLVPNANVTDATSIKFQKNSSGKYLFLCAEGSIGVSHLTDQLRSITNTQITPLDDVYFKLK